MLIFLAILFLYGAIGMERRRGVSFSMITAGLVFAVTVPVVVQDASWTAPPYDLLQLAGFLIGILLLTTGSFFLGRLVRLTITAVTGKRGNATG